jgi:hypothetical protein
MKKTSTLLGFMAIVSLLIAQSPLKKQPSFDFPVSPTISEVNSTYAPAKVKKAGPGDVIYSFDFSSGIPTGWSNAGSSSAALWEYRGAATTPSNAVGSRGAYASGDPIASSSASNGFMIFDSDFLDNGGVAGAFGTGLAPAPADGQLITGVMDFSATPNVTLTMESFCRQFASGFFVSFSTDGGATFNDTVNIHFDVALNTQSDNASIISENVSAAIGGEATVVVAFTYDSNNPWALNANGDGYYFWAIDDIAFVETPNYDIALADFDINHGTKDGIYGYTPMSEVVPVSYTGQIANLGAATATGVMMDAVVAHPSGSSTVSATAGSIIAGVDSVVTTNAYTAADTGFYQVDLEVSMDSADFAANDNFASNDFSVTDSTYGLDNGVITGYLGTNSFTGGEDGFQMLNLFEFSSTYKLNSVWARLSALTRPGGQIYVVVYDTTGTTFGGGGTFANQTSPNFKSDIYTITTADSIKGYVKIPVDFTFNNGGYYVGFEAYSTGGVYTVRLAQDESVDQDPRSSLIQILNTGLYTNPNAFLLRLNENTSNDPCNTVSIAVTATVDDTVSYDPYATITNVNSSGGVPPYVYSWTGPSNYASTAANLTDLLVKGDYDVVSTDADGCEGMATFTVAGNVSTNDVVKNENVTIFPNPSVGLFNLNMTNATGEFTISVKNVIGQTVFNQIVVASSSLNTELDLTNVEKGIYFINVANDSFEITEKVIIK